MTESPKVVGLRGRDIHDGRSPVSDVVSLCEELLEMARAGEIIGLSAAWLFSDNATHKRATGHVSLAMVGRIEQMKTDVLRTIEASP